LVDIAGTMAMNAKYDWVEVVHHSGDDYYVKTLKDGKRDAVVIDHFINYNVDEISGPEGVNIEDIWSGSGYGMKCITKKAEKFGVGIARSKRVRTYVAPTYDEARRLGIDKVGLRKGSMWSVYKFRRDKLSKPIYRDVKFENGTTYGLKKGKWKQV